jgi:hypothetical protein
MTIRSREPRGLGVDRMTPLVSVLLAASSSQVVCWVFLGPMILLCLTMGLILLTTCGLNLPCDFVFAVGARTLIHRAGKGRSLSFFTQSIAI